MPAPTGQPSTLAAIDERSYRSFRSSLHQPQRAERLLVGITPSAEPMGRCQRRPVTLSRPPLAAALAEYGRLVRTNILLAYLADAPLRRRIGAREPTVPRGASEPPACRR